MKNKDFGFGTQIRKSPYFDSTVKWGATGFSVYNHMYIPRDFGSPEKNFWNLSENAIFSYKVDNVYAPDYDSGISWNDPILNIPWGIDENEILVSKKDSKLPFFSDFKSPF